MRNSSGASLVELLVVVLVMSFVAVAAFGMLTTTMASQLKLQNKADSLDSARKTIERLGRTVRMGRQITNAEHRFLAMLSVPRLSLYGILSVSLPKTSPKAIRAR